jgi:hypothetical protein
MAYRRRYRRKRSMDGNMLADTTYIANRLSWQGAAFFGVILFVIFYWLLPEWINLKLSSLQSNTLRPAFEAIFARRAHWLQWLGIALGLICAFFAIRNYFTPQHLDYRSARKVSFLSRLLARWLD